VNDRARAEATFRKFFIVVLGEKWGCERIMAERLSPKIKVG